MNASAAICSTAPTHVAIIEGVGYPARISELPWQAASRIPSVCFTASGYGSKISTVYTVRIEKKWRRIYCRIYSNSGTCYISDGRIVSDVYPVE